MPKGKLNYYENPKALGSRLRRRRFMRHVMPLVKAAHDRTGQCKIIDIGGTASYWKPYQEFLDQMNVHVTIVNLSSSSSASGNLSYMQGDARELPMPDNSFDLVHSNSVIEHVGRWEDMAKMAREVARLAPSYFIQVPYFWFPIEPHFRLPFFHWLPESVRARIVMKAAFGFHPKCENFDQAMRVVQSAQLLDRRQMTTLFPDSKVFSEGVFGFTKSLMAVRG